MSLFKVCTWWSAQCPDFDPNYDSQLLHCCRFGIEENEKDYVIVASHSGFVSVFQPNALMVDETEDEELSSGFRPTDQLLEIKLPNPILQLSSGKFIIGAANEGKRQLVILHPLKVSVYSLHLTEGLAEHGMQFKLNLCFEHKLSKPAYSVCHGHFGGYKSREFFCITHMDSTLTFLEQDGIVYETILVGDRHIPSKMVFNSRTDTFLTVSSYCDLECYRYQDLAQAVDTQKSSLSLPIWTVCIGEYSLDIQLQQITENENLILILCENLLYGISDTSSIKFIKRLDYVPMCFCSFVAGWYYEPNARLIITVISESGTILIYNTSQLIWAAQLSYVPIAIYRTNVNGLPGAICTLCDNGKIDVSYLGSDPQMFQVPPLNMQKLNFEKTQTELIELEKEIKAGIDFTDVSAINVAAERDLNINFSIESTLEECIHSTNMPGNLVSPDDVKMVRSSVKLVAQTNLEQVQVQFYCSAPLMANKAIHTFQQMSASQEELVETHFYMANCCDVASTTITAVISFINKHTIPRVIEKTKSLPMTMFFKTFIPQKESSIKLTITVNQATVPSMEQLFVDEFPIDSTHNATGFKSIYTGKIVTIVAAKNSNRYRIQSDHLPTIAPILEALIQRIENYIEPKVQIVNSSPLPINGLITLVDAHYKSYQSLQIVREKLKNCTIRMRLLERRYFTKLDDKKTGSIDSIMTFLKTTHHELMAHIQSLENAKQNLAKMQCDLSCGLACVNGLIKLIDVPPKGCDTLCSSLMSTVTDYPQQSWEEMTAAGLNILNYVGPLRKNKNAATDDDPTLDVAPFDFDRFKRHLTGLLERVSRSGGPKANDIKDTLTEEDDVIESTDNSKPPKEEESDWIFDVKQTMNILPRLSLQTNINDENGAKSSFSKD
ncbi:protein PTHB1 [Sitodiplosis mosellana]|uniref:protein PTHB1 n=1 Tax=Sitodiplosis mosellana TaxID=263140 RepID=UPI00244539E2|nr:protein PTHB1 [Sitodiplosis mosellana]